MESAAHRSLSCLSICSSQMQKKKNDFTALFLALVYCVTCIIIYQGYQGCLKLPRVCSFNWHIHLVDILRDIKHLYKITKIFPLFFFSSEFGIDLKIHNTLPSNRIFRINYKSYLTI